MIAKWSINAMLRVMSETAEEMEQMASRLMECAKAITDGNRRRLLLREAFELVQRAAALRKAQAGERPALTGYRLRLGDGNGAALWIGLHIEGRIDAIWAAHALAIACSEDMTNSSSGAASIG